ncbi:hypothetical protein B7P33_02125 [Sediminicola luteus]|uniref:Uncharacterized protein n=1 Tax=Sediminicola luteus TaxID=319238 RepID=A0A2A4GAY2_9FLAO|nr:hypothetical protein B7P33_02125 [Sediminicola luteus]
MGSPDASGPHKVHGSAELRGFFYVEGSGFTEIPRPPKVQGLEERQGLYLCPVMCTWGFRGTVPK